MSLFRNSLVWFMFLEVVSDVSADIYNRWTHSTKSGVFVVVSGREGIGESQGDLELLRESLSLFSFSS